MNAPDRTNNVSASFSASVNDYTSIVDEIGDEGNVSNIDITDRNND